MVDQKDVVIRRAGQVVEWVAVSWETELG